jgi:hypothetical protein
MQTGVMSLQRVSKNGAHYVATFKQSPLRIFLPRNLFESRDYPRQIRLAIKPVTIDD